jgi:hypothetical protein
MRTDVAQRVEAAQPGVTIGSQTGWSALGIQDVASSHVPEMFSVVETMTETTTKATTQLSDDSGRIT